MIKVSNTKARYYWAFLIPLIVVIAASAIGVWFSTPQTLLVLVSVVGLIIIIRKPYLGMIVLIFAAVFVAISIPTGTDVVLNATVLLIPGLCAIWLLQSSQQRSLTLITSRVNRPLILFLIMSVFSLLIGNVLWDPNIPRPANLILVQLGQIAIFVLSAFAFWFMAYIAKTVIILNYVTWVFIVLAGFIAIALQIPPVWSIIQPVLTITWFRTPFWICLAALAGGQLLFNRDLSPLIRLGLIVVLIAVIAASFFMLRDSASTVVAVGIVIAVLVWLRWERLRPLFIVTLLGLALSGVLFSSIYSFLGGDIKWDGSGASRLVLSQRVIEMTMRNPITGLGPGAYRTYGFASPLVYLQAVWSDPRISAHNNYVDIFAHTGIVGLGLFVWFLAELGWLALRMKRIYRNGFASGYVNGMLAALISISAVMLMLDWFLPFVYNVGFDGFQASVILWMFLGGLVALENMATPQHSTL